MPRAVTTAKRPLPFASNERERPSPLPLCSTGLRGATGATVRSLLTRGHRPHGPSSTPIQGEGFGFPPSLWAESGPRPKAASIRRREGCFVDFPPPTPPQNGEGGIQTLPSADVTSSNVRRPRQANLRRPIPGAARRRAPARGRALCHSAAAAPKDWCLLGEWTGFAAVPRLTTFSKTKTGGPDADTAWPRELISVCDICGGTDFGPGPMGRVSRSGDNPLCLACGSLERIRNQANRNSFSFFSSFKCPGPGLLI